MAHEDDDDGSRSENMMTTTTTTTAATMERGEGEKGSETERPHAQMRDATAPLGWETLTPEALREEEDAYNRRVVIDMLGSILCRDPKDIGEEHVLSVWRQGPREKEHDGHIALRFAKRWKTNAHGETGDAGARTIPSGVRLRCPAPRWVLKEKEVVEPGWGRDPMTRRSRDPPSPSTGSWSTWSRWPAIWFASYGTMTITARSSRATDSGWPHRSRCCGRGPRRSSRR